MLRQMHFDPLKFLERTLRLDVYYSKHRTHIVLDGLAALPQEKQRQAWRVVRSYKKLLESSSIPRNGICGLPSESCWRRGKQ